MRSSVALFATALVAVQHVVAWNHLTIEGLRQKLDESRSTLVAFISPTEPRSQSLEAEWLKASGDPNDQLPSIDCSAEASTCETYGVQDYPTILFFENGSENNISYEGPRHAVAIMNFVQRYSRPILTEVPHDEVRAFRLIDETVFIGFIAPEDTEGRADLEHVAGLRRAEFTFGIVSDPSIIEQQNVRSPTIICYRQRDGDAKPVGDFADAETLDKLVLDAARPVIGELMPANHQRLLDLGRPMVYIFADTELERASLRMKLHKFARKQRDTLTVVTADPLDFPGLPEKLGILDFGDEDQPDSIYPAGAVHQLSTGRIYRYPHGKPITESALQAWGLDVWQGRVKPWKIEGSDEAMEDRPVAAEIKKKLSIHPDLLKAMGVKIRVGGHDEL